MTTYRTPEIPAPPHLKLARVRRLSMAVSLVVSWLYVMKIGQIFSNKATEAFIRQDRYMLSDAAEEFTIGAIVFLPVLAIFVYWATRLVIASPQIFARYLASRLSTHSVT